jgi:hypothetical protein
VALIDVEVVDAKGQRCPTDDDKVDFTVAGPGIWRGGYNSGKIDSTNNLYLNTEAASTAFPSGRPFRPARLQSRPAVRFEVRAS